MWVADHSRTLASRPSSRPAQAALSNPACRCHARSPASSHSSGSLTGGSPARNRVVSPTETTTGTACGGFGGQRHDRNRRHDSQRNLETGRLHKSRVAIGRLPAESKRRSGATGGKPGAPSPHGHRILLRDQLQRGQPFQGAALPGVPHRSLVAVQAVVAGGKLEVLRRDSCAPSAPRGTSGCCRWRRHDHPARGRGRWAGSGR